MMKRFFRRLALRRRTKPMYLRSAIDYYDWHRMQAEQRERDMPWLKYRY